MDSVGYNKGDTMRQVSPNKRKRGNEWTSTIWGWSAFLGFLELRIAMHFYKSINLNTFGAEARLAVVYGGLTALTAIVIAGICSEVRIVRRRAEQKILAKANKTLIK